MPVPPAPGGEAMRLSGLPVDNATFSFSAGPRQCHNDPRGLIAMSKPLVVLAVALFPLVAGAACPPSCPIPGGSNAALDCHAEYAGAGLRLNYKPFDPAK